MNEINTKNMTFTELVKAMNRLEEERRLKESFTPAHLRQKKSSKEKRNV